MKRKTFWQWLNSPVYTGCYDKFNKKVDECEKIKPDVCITLGSLGRFNNKIDGVKKWIDMSYKKYHFLTEDEYTNLVNRLETMRKECFNRFKKEERAARIQPVVVISKEEYEKLIFSK